MAGADDLESGRRTESKPFLPFLPLPPIVRENPRISGVCFGLPLFIVTIIIMTSYTSLGPGEQLLLISNGGTGKEIINGPTTLLVKPGQEREVRKARRLSPQQYAVVRNVMTGKYAHKMGPDFLFLGPWEEFVAVHDKIVLQARQFMKFHNSLTGKVRVEEGPKRLMPDPFETYPKGVEEAYPVRSLEALVVLNKTSGKKRIAREVGFFVPGPFEEVIERRDATVLKEMEYAIVQNGLTGQFRHEIGPALLFVDAYDKVVSVRSKIVLQKHEYVRFVDELTGFARVVLGPTLIVPNPSEDGPGGLAHNVSQAIVVTEQTSVILLNRTSGQKYEHRAEGIFTPGPYEDILEVRQAVVLRSQEYAVVQDSLTGKFLHYSGPQQLFLGPYERLVQKLQKIVLQKQQFVQLVDRRTGAETVISGPQTIVPAPEQCEKDYTNACQMNVQKAIVMKADIAVLTLNKTTGIRRVVDVDSGEGGIFTPKPYEEIIEVRTATVLKQQEYAVVKDNMEGNFRHVEGPTLLHLAAYEELVRVALKVVLSKFQYIRLVDEREGVERVVVGPKVFVPDPTEVSVSGETRTKEHTQMVQESTLIDKDQALLVVNHATGQQQLETTEGMWTPAPYEHLLEKRPLIRVLANEAVVVRDFEGELTVHDGTTGDAGTNFFLQPRCAIVSMEWTQYQEPNQNGFQAVSKTKVEKIDMRIQRTFYSFEVRTKDNVRLMLMGTIFWRVADVSKMILGTSDPSGDVWQHSRSSFMQAVSDTAFDQFMGSFNELAEEAYQREIQDDDGFYEGRGVELLSVEVTGFEAVDDETKATLQRINDETTNQITLLKKQEGENAVKSAKMKADIELEKEQTAAEKDLEERKTALIDKRSENSILERKIDAQSSAQKFTQSAKTFINEVKDAGLSVATGLDLFQTLQTAKHHNTDTKNIGSGKATLFLSSQDVDLKLTKQENSETPTN